MSRSRRKTSVCANTMAESDRFFKRNSHKKIRRVVKQRIMSGDDGHGIPDEKKLMTSWPDKDGKHWFDESKWPKLMRK